MRETLYIAIAIWVPILCVVAVILIVMPLLMVGVVSERLGKFIIKVALLLKWKLEDWMLC